MPNLRIVSDNAIERATTLSASSTAGTNAPSLLANDLKDYLWRGLSKVERLDAAWATPESIQAVGGPNCNLSPTAQWRIRLSNELSITNLFKYTETFSNGAWNPNGVNVTDNVAGVVTPSGSQNADKLGETATNAPHFVAQSYTFTSADIGKKVTFSVWVKGAERNLVCVRFDNVSTAAPTNSNVYVNLTTGAMTGLIAGGWAYSATLHAASGFWRVTATGTVGTAGIIQPYVMTAATSGTYGFLGVAGYGIYVWGAQFEFGDKATSYYPSLAATLGVRSAGHIDSWQSYDYDSGWVDACPVAATQLRRMTAAQAASAYAWGGGAFARHWLPTEKQALRLAVDINDANNLQGYVEMANLVAGPVLEVKKNADYGAEASLIDATQVARSGAGSAMPTQSTRSSSVSFTLSKLDPEDRDRVWRALRSNGVGYPVWLSVFPEHDDKNLEAAYQVWGNFVETPSMSLPSFNVASAKLKVQSS